MRYILLMIISAVSLSVTAQNNNALTISGHIMDASEKEPLAQATIQLFWAKDSSFVGGSGNPLFIL